MDLDELRALNSSYVQSVQDGNVAWFAEHLAEDFLASNPDGSLVDKKAFLEQTARPVTIRGLVEDHVNIRLLGDIAIIHARTTYTSSDFAEHHGRYTDIWAKRAGRWVAVAAHVTR